jgi:hypothetical protein
MAYYKRVFQIDDQWCCLHLPKQPNGFAVLVIGDMNHYVNEYNSLWEDRGARRQLVDTLLSAGYTVFYSHLYGKHWGNENSCKLAEELVHYILLSETLNPKIHLLAEGMGALTALSMMENEDVPVRSAAFINPCLDLKVYLKEAAETKWFYKQLLQQISAAYQTPTKSVEKMVAQKQELSQYKAEVPVKIWHSTSGNAFPFKVHSRPYAKNRKELGSPISLLLHVPEKRFYFNDELCQFFKKHESEL